MTTGTTLLLLIIAAYIPLAFIAKAVHGFIQAVKQNF